MSAFSRTLLKAKLQYAGEGRRIHALHIRSVSNCSCGNPICIPVEKTVHMQVVRSSDKRSRGNQRLDEKYGSDSARPSFPTSDEAFEFLRVGSSSQASAGQGLQILECDRSVRYTLADLTDWA